MRGGAVDRCVWELPPDMLATDSILRTPWGGWNYLSSSSTGDLTGSSLSGCLNFTHWNAEHDLWGPNPLWQLFIFLA